MTICNIYGYVLYILEMNVISSHLYVVCICIVYKSMLPIENVR